MALIFTALRPDSGQSLLARVGNTGGQHRWPAQAGNYPTGSGCCCALRHGRGGRDGDISICVCSSE